MRRTVPAFNATLLAGRALTKAYVPVVQSASSTATAVLLLAPKALTSTSPTIPAFPAPATASPAAYHPPTACRVQLDWPSLVPHVSAHAQRAATISTTPQWCALPADPPASTAFHRPHV